MTVSWDNSVQMLYKYSGWGDSTVNDLCANKWLKMPSEVYALLQKTGCIDHYLVPYYDVLHTLGTDYLVEDIKEYLGVRGVIV